jgi:Tol biopolymer transport system component
VNALKVSLSFAFLVFLITWMGPAGCGPVGPLFPGNGNLGDDDRELLFSLEGKWVDPREPTWSPGCDRVAFIRYDSKADYGKWYELWIYDVSSGVFNEVSDLSNLCPRQPEWSHNGEWIGYYSGAEDHTYIIRPDGTDNTKITSEPLYDLTFGAAVSWSPDDREVLIRNDNQKLLIVNVSDPANPVYRDITPDESYGWTEVRPGGWSPDGDTISFVGHGPSGDEVCVTDPRGSYYYVIIPAQSNWGSVSLGDWSPDGRYLLMAIIGGGDGGWTPQMEELWAYDVENVEFKQITYINNGYYRIDAADWGANGRVVFKDYVIEGGKDPERESTWGKMYTVRAPD